MSNDGVSRERKEEEREIRTQRTISRSVPDEWDHQIGRHCSGASEGDTEEKITKSEAIGPRCGGDRLPEGVDTGCEAENEVDAEESMKGPID